MEAIVAAPEITMLNHLDVSIDDYIIKVRILRKWRQSDRKIPNEDYSIEMILIDEEGNKIQAHVLKKWFFRFEKSVNLIPKRLCPSGFKSHPKHIGAEGGKGVFLNGFLLEWATLSSGVAILSGFRVFELGYILDLRCNMIVSICVQVPSAAAGNKVSDNKNLNETVYDRGKIMVWKFG
ncbi:hypothetical protein R6Q59_003593 [Mikania micrantha]